MAIMTFHPNTVPNPKRVAAGRQNRAKWRGLTPAGAERLRQSALVHQPWRFATGPRTPAGKARAALNGKRQQKGQRSVREIRRLRAELAQLSRTMAATRKLAAESQGAGD